MKKITVVLAVLSLLLVLFLGGHAVGLMFGSVAYGAEAVAEVVPVVTVAATPTSNPWVELLSSPAFTGFLMTVLLTVAKLFLDKQSAAKQLETDRWAGVVWHIYNAVEKEGLLNKWSGHDKLARALEKFPEEYMKVFGHYPGEAERTDFALDLAKASANQKV